MLNKNILVLGAGRSSAALISYLLQQAEQNSWRVTVGDVELKNAQAHVGRHPHGEAILFSIDNTETSTAAIAAADVVISLMPAHLHTKAAALCIRNRKHLITASYVSEEMKQFDSEAKQLGLLFLNECGLDPGIDHMSAMQVVDRIREAGGQVTSFESFTGGLIAPDTDPENPWRYKFTWNPRNVVVAGQGTAKLLQDGKYRYIPYQQLFTRTTPVVVPGFGAFDGYANRDSLKYLETYRLQHIQTMVRGTLRNKGFCSAWNVLVQLGCCDESYIMENIGSMTHREFLQSFLPTNEPAEKIVAGLFNLKADGEELKRLVWSGLFSSEKIGLSEGSPARILEHILNKRWKLQPGDKDFIVMWHRFRYTLADKQKCVEAYLTATGTDEVQTAMAKTVGLPLGIAAKLLLQNRFRTVGVTIPVTSEFYSPILEELSLYGIALQEQEVAY